MKAKVLFAMMAALLVSSLIAVPVMAQGKGAKTGSFSAPFTFTMVYDGSGWYKGPEVYYGEPVTVVYSATNSWTWIVKGDNVRQNLVQEGIAEVYNMSGDLIDIRDFHALEQFYDEGGDACTLYGNWYQPGWWSGAMERYHYHWRIQGVYEFEVWCHDGYWEWVMTAYTSPPTITDSGEFQA